MNYLLYTLVIVTITLSFTSTSEDNS